MNLKSMLCSVLLASPALLSAQTSSYSITADFPFASDYVFRGIKYADDSIQPSLEFTKGNFYAGIWTNQPVKGSYDNEFDYYMGYTMALSDIWTLDVGFTYYDYPETAGDAEQFEPFIGLAGSAANGWNASLYLYRETEFEVTTLISKLGYTRDLSDKTSLGVTGEIGGIMAGGTDSYTYWALSSQLTTKLNDKASAYLGATWSNTDLNHDVNPEGDEALYLTTGLSLSF